MHKKFILRTSNSILQYKWKTSISALANYGKLARAVINTFTTYIVICCGIS